MIYCSIVQFKWFLWVYRLVDNTKKVLEQKVFSHASGRLLTPYSSFFGTNIICAYIQWLLFLVYC